MQSQPDKINVPDWVIEPEPIEVISSKVIKGNTTKSVGFSLVYPDGKTGYVIVGKVINETWQPASEIKEIVIKWKE